MSSALNSEVPMGTRPDAIDPGLALYLAGTEKIDARQFDDMIDAQCGLLGISETSADMRDVLRHEAQDVRPDEAVALLFAVA